MNEPMERIAIWKDEYYPYYHWVGQDDDVYEYKMSVEGSSEKMEWVRRTHADWLECQKWLKSLDKKE